MLIINKMIQKRGLRSKNHGKSLAFSQIFLLVFSIVAISYAVGSSIGVVSGQSNVFQFSFNIVLLNEKSIVSYLIP